MCIIKLRREREEEDPVIPIRPVVARRHTPTRSIHSVPASIVEPRHSQHPVVTPRISVSSSVTSRGRGRPPPQHLVVVEHHSPRSTTLSIREGSRGSFQYGTGPVRTISATQGRSSLKPEQRRPEDDRRKRSGSVSFISPRQSGASRMSTRDKVVVVDESGRKREYYRRDNG